MADSKITALTAISTVDPTADPLVIVDVSDTSMAASGTTKKSTINQLLGAGGTATLASATISGAASAAGLSVTGSTIPTNGVYLPSANNLGFAYNSTLGMTLNSTGLGVGTSNFAYKINAAGFIAAVDPSFTGTGGSLIGAMLNNDNTAPGLDIRRWTGTAGTHGTTYICTDATGATFFYNGQQASNTKATSLKMTLDASGRLLVGRTAPLLSETFSSTGFAIIGGSTNQAIIGEASGNVFAGSLTNVPFRIRTNNTEIAQFDTSGNFLSYLTSTAPTLSTNGAMVFNLTSNTNLRISVRGTDGVTRTANITLA